MTIPNAPWTPSARAEVITRRTYCRPTSDGGFETWDQVIDRVITHQRWLWERARGERPLEAEQNAELEELRTLLLDRKTALSGRTLWLGGTEISRKREASQFNPLPRSQRFITRNGVASFGNFLDGDLVEVLTHKGNFKRGRVAAAGVRKMLRLHMRRGRSTTTVDTSVDHNWILTDERRVRADALEVGDKLHVAPTLSFYDWVYDDAPTDEQLWWCYGFVFGDGAIARSGNSVTSRVRLCGAKGQYLPRFQSFGFEHSFPPSCDGEAFVYTGRYLKTLPERDADPRLIRAFLRGYLDANGNKKSQHGETRFTGISTSSATAANFINTWAPTFGLYILSDEFVEADTNYGTRRAYEFSFTTGGGLAWRVDQIEEIVDEECWCLTVEDDHSFVFPNGVVTSNCSFLKVETVHDVVDAFWLLLQGCGVGFEPVTGNLNGFTNPAVIEVVRSQRHLLVQQKGVEHNQESWEDNGDTWRLTVGDSAEAWSKAAGKIMAQKRPFKRVIIDFSQVRPAGYRLSGYGWISSGDETLARALPAICEIMNRRAGKLLTRIDILDICNWLGTTLSSRRSAQIAVVPYGDPEWREFAMAKRDHYEHNPQRSQSNNSLVFHQHPGRAALAELFQMMQDAGGSEPGLLNAEAAKKRAPWYSGANPCAEILLPNKGFCNLVEVNLARFNGDLEGLVRAMMIMGRANYRQTCVNLVDGVLQRAWHENQEFLRLTGVGITGVVRWELANDDKALAEISELARFGADSMADELGMPRSKAVTTIKPSGTLSKIMDTTEGAHKPLGRYIFNNVRFSKHDPYLEVLRAANYRMFTDPYNADSTIVTFPIDNGPAGWDVVEGREVNLEPAVAQLERYRLLMNNYVDHNCSVTISYSPDEVPAIVDWLDKNWDDYVGVSFLYRTDPTKTAADLGYPYLPQEVVTREAFDEYAATLKPLKRGRKGVQHEEHEEDLAVDAGEECATGACPIR